MPDKNETQCVPAAGPENRYKPLSPIAVTFSAHLIARVSRSGRIVGRPTFLGIGSPPGRNIDRIVLIEDVARQGGAVIAGLDRDQGAAAAHALGVDMSVLCTHAIMRRHRNGRPDERRAISRMAIHMLRIIEQP